MLLVTVTGKYGGFKKLNKNILFNFFIMIQLRPLDYT